MRDIGTIFLFLLALIGGQLSWKLGLNQIGGFLVWGTSIFDTLGKLVTNGYFLLGCLAYALAVVLWFYLLSRYDLSYIYPFTALLYIGTLLVSRFFLGETIPIWRWVGVFFIIIGVTFLSQSRT